MSPYFNDDGTEFNPDLMPKPGLCATCRKDDQPDQEIGCHLTRNDQAGEDQFICFAYESISGPDATNRVLADMEASKNQEGCS